MDKNKITLILNKLALALGITENEPQVELAEEPQVEETPAEEPVEEVSEVDALKSELDALKGIMEDFEKRLADATKGKEEAEEKVQELQTQLAEIETQPADQKINLNANEPKKSMGQLRLEALRNAQK